MSSNPRRLHYLFRLYLNDTATPDELREFWQLFTELDETDDSIKRELWQTWNKTDAGNQPEERDWENILERIHTGAETWEKKDIPVISRISFWRVAAAAAAMVTIILGAYLLFLRKAPKEIAKAHINTQAPQINDVPAGGNNATLTLSNGATIILNNAPNGSLAQQGNTNILKLSSGQLAYNTPGSPSMNYIPAAIQYNTLTTPRGGQYEIKLPDGTLVWLNSSSSIHYPTAFLNKERVVDIRGEAYFEVAHRPDQPFKVTVNGMTVEVLGTHFNINAYDDEPFMRTTLLEGSIKFRAGRDERLLIPGQQLQVQAGGRSKLINNADVEQAVAWKNGVFSFHNTSIYEVMRQISRWYDVDVSFREPMNLFLNGSIQKEVNVSEVFKMLELTGEVNFKIEGRKITVMK